MISRSKDPTLTLTLRRRATGEINRRYNTLKQRIRKRIKEGALVANAEEEEEKFSYISEENLALFLAWVSQITSLEVLDDIVASGIDVKNHWLNNYIKSAYEKSASRAYNSAARAKKAAGLLSAPTGGPFSSVVHMERSNILFNRVYTQLKGVTETMGQQIAEVLSDGMMKGDSIDNISKNLFNRVDKIGKVRSRLIARTEIVRAHNMSAINEAERLEKELGEPVKLLWITALDGRERPTHRARHKVLYTREEVNAKVGEPNCRCAVTPWAESFGSFEDL